MLSRVLLLLVACVARAAWLSPPRMDASWRPKTVDPLGQAFGMPQQRANSFSIWLDLRESEITFAQQVIIKLFFGVRSVIDEAGRSLPKGSAVEGLLFDAARYDRADTIGQDIEVFLDNGGGSFVNATIKDTMEPVSLALRAPTTPESLAEVMAEFESFDADGVQPVIALPADAMLWASALTGLQPSDLQCLEGNEGA